MRAQARHSPKGVNITLAEGPDGHIMAHDWLCPEIEKQRAQGRFLATLFEVELNDVDCPRHSCLEKK